LEGVRLRQAVLVASELEPVAARLRDELALGEPFVDPGVGEFGLTNAVFALGDQFLEVISPHEPGTAAGRFLERHGGDGGYMLIFQLDDLAGARARVNELGVRIVWQIDLPDISGTHLHPADTRGALISLDRPEPPQTWRWGGPGWEQRAAPGRIDGVTLAVSEPDVVQETWSKILGEVPAGVSFSFDEHERGLTEIAVTVPGPGGTTDIGGVRFRMSQEEDR
jgi:hypothetical protein